MPTEIYKTLDFQTINTATGLCPPFRPTDAVRLTDLEDLAQKIRQEIANGGGLTKLIVDLTDGVISGEDTTFEITHNFGSMDVIEKVYDKTTGESLNTEFVRVMTDLNACQVVFRGNISVEPSRYRLLLVKLA